MSLSITGQRGKNVDALVTSLLSTVVPEDDLKDPSKPINLTRLSGKQKGACVIVERGSVDKSYEIAVATGNQPSDRWSYLGAIFSGDEGGDDSISQQLVQALARITNIEHRVGEFATHIGHCDKVQTSGIYYAATDTQGKPTQQSEGFLHVSGNRDTIHQSFRAAADGKTWERVGTDQGSIGEDQEPVITWSTWKDTHDEHNTDPQAHRELVQSILSKAPRANLLYTTEHKLLDTTAGTRQEIPWDMCIMDNYGMGSDDSSGEFTIPYTAYYNLTFAAKFIRIYTKTKIRASVEFQKPGQEEWSTAAHVTGDFEAFDVTTGDDKAGILVATTTSQDNINKPIELPQGTRVRASLIFYTTQENAVNLKLMPDATLFAIDDTNTNAAHRGARYQVHRMANVQIGEGRVIGSKEVAVEGATQRQFKLMQKIMNLGVHPHATV